MSGAESETLSPMQRALATLGGAGLSPVMPGTCGSVVAVLPCFFVPDAAYAWVLAAGVVVATALSVRLARRLPPGGDPGWFVMDEAAGMGVAAFAFSRPAPLALLVAFVLFRVFDMTKPPPLRRLERVGQGYGIVLDDLGAGVYALALTHVILPLLG